MAHTQISDVVVPSVFAAYVQDLSTELSLLVQSGIIRREAQFDNFLAGGGEVITLPMWNDLDDTEANISDDTNTAAVPEKIGSKKVLAVRNNRNQAWSAMDLTGQLAGSDPMEAIARRVASYWVRQDQAKVNAIIKGLAANNATIVNDIADSGTAGGNDGTVGTDNLVSSDAFLDTFALMGDHKSNIAAIAMHSAVHTRLQKLNLIDFVPDARGEVNFGTYMGKAVIVDDGLATEADATTTPASTEYFTVCYGPGAFAWGEGSPRVPAEVERQALLGSGGGEEVLVSRREYILHPAGFSAKSDIFDDANGKSATNAALASGVTPAYEMKLNRKQIPLAVLKSNG